jgi:hypothetical protein
MVALIIGAMEIVPYQSNLGSRALADVSVSDPEKKISEESHMEVTLATARQIRDPKCRAQFLEKSGYDPAKFDPNVWVDIRTNPGRESISGAK